jgi:hypothetical protein
MDGIMSMIIMIILQFTCMQYGVSTRVNFVWIVADEDATASFLFDSFGAGTGGGAPSILSATAWKK